MSIVPTLTGQNLRLPYLLSLVAPKMTQRCGDETNARPHADRARSYVREANAFTFQRRLSECRLGRKFRRPIARVIVPAVLYCSPQQRLIRKVLCVTGKCSERGAL
jgi:hypothetical protein